MVFWGIEPGIKHIYGMYGGLLRREREKRRSRSIFMQLHLNLRNKIHIYKTAAVAHFNPIYKFLAIKYLNQ